MISDKAPVAASCTLDIPPDDNDTPHQPHGSFSWNKLIAAFGLPALISVAAIDPGNLEVDLQAGSSFGYTLIWALLLSSVVGWLLQTLAAHLTICSGIQLSELYARAYRHDKVISWSLFAISELSIVAFDIAEVVGTAFALQMLFGWPLWFGMVMSALDTTLVLFLQRNGMTKIELIIEGLLFILAACLLYEFFLSRPAFSAILEGAVVPSLGPRPREGAVLAVGLLGSVIMSHNLFLHSWLVHARMHSGEPSYDEASTSDLSAMSRFATVEAAAIFVATFVINTCLLAVSASLPHDLVPDSIGLKEAGAILQNLLGSEMASKAWAIALLCSGHAATVTGSLASQAVCEGFLGFSDTNRTTAMVLTTRVVAIVPALAAALFAGEEGSDHLIVVSQVVLSLALPFGVIPMFKLFAFLRRTERGRVSNVPVIRAGYIAFGLVVVANLFVLFDIVREVCDVGNRIAANLLLVVGTGAFALLWKLIISPVHLTEAELVGESHEQQGESEPLLPGPKPVYAP